MILHIDPVPKPRQTRSDKWRRRPCVMRYRAYADKVRELMPDEMLDDSYQLVFFIPMPKSWSKKKKRGMVGKPHQKRPDLDNLVKAFLDALYTDDSRVWHVNATKYWAYDGTIEIH